MFRQYDPRDQEGLKEIFDSPKDVVDALFVSQQKIVCGYKPYVPSDKYNEALNPKHATLSLTGEPFLYPWIPELIEELKKRKLTVFIVTNGSIPSTLQTILEKRSYPTQLYITLPTPGVENFLSVHRPLEREVALENIYNSLKSIGRGVPFRTVARLTVAEGLNLIDPEGYTEMISGMMKPSFIEVKGVVHVGATEKRLPRTAMPSHSRIVSFAKQLEKLTGYKIVAESEVSRLVILSNKSEPLLIPDLSKE
jgi:tRNA wybutosine-synthesizing protein 1